MTKKKITFPSTPNRGNLGEAIDNWVVGEKKEQRVTLSQRDVVKKPEYARTTFQIPVGLYKKLKKAALMEDKSITQKLTEILEQTISDV